MEKFVLDLIKCLSPIFGGTKTRARGVDISRPNVVYPVFMNIHNFMFATRRSNPELFACEAMKAKCEPAAYFPGMPGKEGGPGFNAFPIYLVVPWFAENIPDELIAIRGLVVFNRVIGPDPILGPYFDNGVGLWGAILASDELSLKNLPYQEYDKSLILALGENWRDLSWLSSLLMQSEIIYKLKK